MFGVSSGADVSIVSIVSDVSIVSVVSDEYEVLASQEGTFDKLCEKADKSLDSSQRIQ